MMKIPKKVQCHQYCEFLEEKAKKGDIADIIVAKEPIHYVGEPKDHVVYDRTDGHAKWLFDTSTNTFQALHLPFYFANAPQCIKTELIDHIRKIAQEIYPNDAPLPTEVRAWRDSPSTKALRSAAKTGQSSLEAWE